MRIVALGERAKSVAKGCYFIRAAGWFISLPVRSWPSSSTSICPHAQSKKLGSNKAAHVTTKGFTGSSFVAVTTWPLTLLWSCSCQGVQGNKNDISSNDSRVSFLVRPKPLQLAHLRPHAASLRLCGALPALPPQMGKRDTAGDIIYINKKYTYIYITISVYQNIAIYFLIMCYIEKYRCIIFWYKFKKQRWTHLLYIKFKRYITYIFVGYVMYKISNIIFYLLVLKYTKSFFF